MSAKALIESDAVKANNSENVNFLFIDVNLKLEVNWMAIIYPKENN